MKKIFILLAGKWVVGAFPLFSQVEVTRETCLTQNKFDNRYASYSPDGGKIVFESNRDGNWNIYLMDSDGANQQRLTTHPGDDRSPGWHPNGKKILFESNRDGKNELYVITLKNGKTRRISKQDYNGQWMFGSFSPGGKRIAASLQESEDKSNIVLINKRGKIIKRITNENKRSYAPRWSKNGNEIVYFSRKDTDNADDEIYRFNIKNGEEVRLTNWPGHNFCPSWSADNRKIVYVTSMETTRPEIYIMDTEGRNPVRVTVNEDGDTLPDWAPHKNSLLITGYRNGHYQICELELRMDRP